MIDNIELKYSVGALLYTPALNSKIARAVIQEDLGGNYSLALCLEDTVAPDMVAHAEAQTRETLRQLWGASQSRAFYLPKLFIRVRAPGAGST